MAWIHRLPRTVRPADIEGCWELLNRESLTAPVTLAERSKAWTLFTRLEAEIVGSNPKQGMGVWYLYAFVLSCVDVDVLWRADNSSNESYRLQDDHETEKKSRQGPKGAVDLVKRNVESRYGVGLRFGVDLVW
jgi:hypothetical protein